MGHVSVTVFGRAYTLACDDGEEPHLAALAESFDARLMELSQSVGAVGEARILLMMGLVLLDELAERDERLNALETEVGALRAGGSAEARARVEKSEETVAMVLESAARRIEDLVQRVSERPQ